jgi:hypothetical protein
VRVKVVIAWGPDFGCYEIPAHGSRWYDWAVGTFDGLEDC